MSSNPIAVRRTIFAAVAAFAAAACSETTKTSQERGGTLVIASTSDAGTLFPPLVTLTTGREVTEQIYDYLTEVSPSLNTLDDRTFARRLAKSWDWSRDSMSLAVHIEPAARWHDGVPVRSDDVTLTYQLYTHPALGSPMKSQLAAIDSVTARDSLTVVFWFNKRYPLQFYDATSQMQILPKHIFGAVPADSLREFASTAKPIGTGPYRFVSWKPGESLELAADTVNYRVVPRITRVIWRIFPEPASAVKALFAREVDVYEYMRPEDVRLAANDSTVKVISAPGSDYAFMLFNFREPKRTSPHHLFASREIRRAITMAVDRESMVRNVLDTLAQTGIGPTIRSFPSTDSTLHAIPYDPEQAAKLLDSLGWKVDPAARVRTKDGKPLKFSIIVPSTSSNRVKMGVLLQEQLRKIGVAVDLDQMEFATLFNRISNRDFDAALWSWHMGTSPAAARELWTREAAQEDGNNFGSATNPVFDALLDSAVQSFDGARAAAYYNRAYQTMIDDAAAIWLYEPKTILGVNRRIHTGPMRPDSWWWSLPEWYIPSSERIARDNALPH